MKLWLPICALLCLAGAHHAIAGAGAGADATASEWIKQVLPTPKLRSGDATAATAARVPAPAPARALQEPPVTTFPPFTGYPTGCDLDACSEIKLPFAVSAREYENKRGDPLFALVTLASSGVPFFGVVRDVFSSFANVWAPSGEDPFKQFEVDMLDMVDLKIKKAKLEDDSSDFKKLLENIRKNFILYQEKINPATFENMNSDEIKANNEAALFNIKEAASFCSTYQSWLTTSGMFDLAKLAFAQEYCMMCSGVYGAWGLEAPDSPSPKEGLEETLDFCADTAVTLIEPAIKERLENIETTLKPTKNKKNFYCTVWNYFHQEKSADGYATIVNWKNKGKCKPGPKQHDPCPGMQAAAIKCIDNYRIAIAKPLRDFYRKAIVIPSHEYSRALAVVQAEETTEDDYALIELANTGMCIDSNNGRNNGQQPYMWPCNPKNVNQQWRVGKNRWELELAGGGNKCLRFHDTITPLSLETCHWSWVPRRHFYVAHGKIYWLRVDRNLVVQSHKNPGSALWVAPLVPGVARQKWDLVYPYHTRKVMIMVTTDTRLHMCIDSNNGRNNGQQPYLYPCSAKNVNQQWLVNVRGEIKLADGSNKCWDVKHGNTNVPINLQECLLEADPNRLFTVAGGKILWKGNPDVVVEVKTAVVGAKITFNLANDSAVGQKWHLVPIDVGAF